MSKLRLTFACWNYDRTRALLEQQIQPDGIDLNYINLPVEETFFRMLRYGEFDVAEMSLSSYAVLNAGKGEIDALYTPRMPSCFRNSAGKVKRLFDNFAEIERDYFRRTRIFPIMHTVVIRREIYDRNRWVAQSLFKAFRLAQQEVYEDLIETAALKVMLPWLPAHVEETRREMGHDFWPYGLQPNHHTLATFLRYSYEQGLSKHLLEPEQLFVPKTLEAFKI